MHLLRFTLLALALTATTTALADTPKKTSPGSSADTPKKDSAPSGKKKTGGTSDTDKKVPEPKPPASK